MFHYQWNMTRLKQKSDDHDIRFQSSSILASKDQLDPLFHSDDVNSNKIDQSD
jgi:hypothetical protein